MKQEKLYSETLPDGRVQYRYRYKDLSGKYRRVSCIKPNNSRRNYNEALRELQNRAVDASFSRPTLEQALLLYLEEKERVLRPQTVLCAEMELRKMNEAIGDMLLDALTVLDVKRAASSISEKNHTYNERIRRYKAFLRWCYTNELLKENIADRITKLPDNRKERIQDKYLEVDELKRLLDGMKVPMWYYLTYFMVLSGLRIGEAFALTVDDVGKYITVDKTYSLTIKEVGPTKTDGSTREVFVQPELRRLLDEYEIFRAENFTKTKVYFPGNVGGYLGYNAYNKYLRLTSQKAIGRVITPHALRHTSASLLIAQGVPLETVSRRLGHSDSHITKAIYLHLTEQLKKSDDEAIARTQLLP